MSLFSNLVVRFSMSAIFPSSYVSLIIKSMISFLSKSISVFLFITFADFLFPFSKSSIASSTCLFAIASFSFTPLKSSSSSISTIPFNNSDNAEKGLSIISGCGSSSSLFSFIINESESNPLIKNAFVFAVHKKLCTFSFGILFL